MQAITIKMDGKMLKEIDNILEKNRYSTRTEFIRDAIRVRLVALDHDRFMAHLSRIRGISKRKTTDEERHAVGEKVFAEFEKKFILSRKV